MRSLKTVFAIAGILCSATAATAQTPVSDVEARNFIEAANSGKADILRSMFEGRVVQMAPVLQAEKTDESAFLKSLNGCKFKGQTRFPDDPEVFFEWLCPERPWNGVPSDMAGVVAKLSHKPIGLALFFAEQGVQIPGVKVLPPRPIKGVK